MPSGRSTTRASVAPDCPASATWRAPSTFAARSNAAAVAVGPTWCARSSRRFSDDDLRREHDEHDDRGRGRERPRPTADPCAGPGAARELVGAVGVRVAGRRVPPRSRARCAPRAPGGASSRRAAQQRERRRRLAQLVDLVARGGVALEVRVDARALVGVERVERVRAEQRVELSGRAGSRGSRSFAHPRLDQRGPQPQQPRPDPALHGALRAARGAPRPRGRCARRSTRARSPRARRRRASRARAGPLRASVSCMTSRSRSMSTSGCRNASRSSRARRADSARSRSTDATVHLREQERPHRTPRRRSKRSGSRHVRTNTSCTTSSASVRSLSTRRASPKHGPAWRRYSSSSARLVAARRRRARASRRRPRAVAPPTSSRPRPRSCAPEMFGADRPVG